MANIPYPLTATDVETLRTQIYELIRQVYEEKIGGADLGDVFSIPGDVLTLVLGDNSGLVKTDNALSVYVWDDGGLQIVSGGIEIKIVSAGGLQVTTSGVSIKLDGTSLVLSGSGLKVGQSSFISDPVGGATQDIEARAAIVSILDLLLERGLMAGPP